MTEPKYSVTYGNEELDVYDAPDSTAKPLIVFVHGGAWRSENKEEHSLLAIRLRDLTTCPVAVLDYRLTNANNLKHPAHATDVLDALAFLITWPDPPFDPTRLYIVAHSAGAHIITSIFLDAAPSFTSLPPDNHALKPHHVLLHAVQAIALASGIYDLDMLKATFPDYDDWFLSPAFPHPYQFWNTTRYPLHASSHAMRWHVIHSTGDALIDLPQSEAIFNHLNLLYDQKGWDPRRITKDWDTLVAPHYYVKDPEFAHLIAEWIKQDMVNY